MTHFKTLFGIDLRALALFRVSIGTLLIIDLLLRSRYITAHYSDLGLYPSVTKLSTTKFLTLFSKWQR